MRKYIVGILIGFILSFAVGAHAEVASMIGKVIDGAFPVKVNGVTLDNQAIVVEGTSYLPVRSFGDATGYDVSFDADMGISLTSKKEATTSQMTTQTVSEPTHSPSPTPSYTMEYVDSQIEKYKSWIWMAQVNIDKNAPDKEKFENDLITLNAELQKWEDMRTSMTATPAP